ncbi:tRNA-uridine aminocarboxypropyltransferase 2 isoform X1 [Carettochelys insculpta]|uniref:tRNA-uridine aminocarboxypropyltransferase 2 isoform X1 n=1 Tax=Carettochelys insculpta TaxID=44489 RepID=UPI003EBC41A4
METAAAGSEESGAAEGPVETAAGREDGGGFEGLWALPVERCVRRAECGRCGRPQKVCLCPFFPVHPLKVSTCLYIIQHPAEESRVLRTVPLLAACLPRDKCKVLIGRRFGEDRYPELAAVCRNSNTLILYPGAEAANLEEVALVLPTPSTIIIIDGTWSQAKDIFYKNSLFRLPKQLHHRKDWRALARCQWSRRAHQGHQSRPAPRRSTDRPQGGDDGGASTPGRRRTPSCWQSSVGSWRSQSSTCRWRSGSLTYRSRHWPGARRHGGPLCARSSVSRTSWPPMPRRPLLCPPCLLHPPLHPPSHCHPPLRALPPRGTWGQLTPAGHISRSARPPASPGQG